MKSSDYEKLIRKILADVAKEKNIAHFTVPKEVLRDSLEIVEFIVLLETHLDIEIDDVEIMNLDTSSVENLAESVMVLSDRVQATDA